MYDMIEFLIRTRESQDWPAVHRDGLSQVLTPGGWDCVGVSGWGDYRLGCGDTEISLSGELVGWQVSFEGPMLQDVATRLICRHRQADRAGDQSTDRLDPDLPVEP